MICCKCSFGNCKFIYSGVARRVSSIEKWKSYACKFTRFTDRKNGNPETTAYLCTTMLRLETILESQRSKTSYKTLLKLIYEVFLPVVSAFCQGRRVLLLDCPYRQMISVTVLQKRSTNTNLNSGLHLLYSRQIYSNIESEWLHKVISILKLAKTVTS